MIHKMTEEEYREHEDRMTGLCDSCGEEREMCEPDARNYDCEHCGENMVFGVPELLMMGQVEFTE
jgi:hypothetical protein